MTQPCIAINANTLASRNEISPRKEIVPENKLVDNFNEEPKRSKNGTKGSDINNFGRSFVQ